jgi:fluoride ion exporter CrcB/FEX
MLIKGYLDAVPVGTILINTWGKVVLNAFTNSVAVNTGPAFLNSD